MASRVLAINIQLPAGASVPPGTPLTVELRDTSFADASAVLLKQVQATIETARSGSVRITADPGPLPDGTTVWAHLDVDRDGRVSRGDYITVQSYPAAANGTPEMTIQLKKV